MQRCGRFLERMRKACPLLVMTISVLGVDGCGGSSTTSVTPTVDPSGGTSGATTPSPDPGGGGSMPAPTPAPGPGPTGGPSPNPTPTTPGDFVWTVESSGRTEPLSAIWGASAHDVWAAGGHGVVHSSGDGAWTTVREDDNADFQALFGDGGWIFAGGVACAGGICQGGILERSADHGATWTTETLGSGVSGFTAAAGSVYADSGDAYVSNDDFATSATIPLAFATSYGVLADGGALFAYGGLRGAQIRRTTDGGTTWTTVYSGFSGSQSGYINAVTRGGTTMFALANACSVPSCVGAIFRSRDDGNNWAEASRPQDYLSGVWAASADEIFVGGTALMRSRDGGDTFTKVPLPVDKTILALWGAGANELYAVSYDGAILHGKR